IVYIVWQRCMFFTGMGTAMETFFQTTTMIISIPSVVILASLFLSLWGGSIRVNSPRRVSPAFLLMCVIRDAVRAALLADVRHRRAHAPAARPGVSRHPSARHVLRDCALPLRGGSGDA